VARRIRSSQYPFVTACCGMESMSAMAGRYDIARFGAEFPASRRGRPIC